LGGLNDVAVINSVCSFMYKYAIWRTDDKIISTKKQLHYVPHYYHNISFVLTFCKTAHISEELLSTNTQPDSESEELKELKLPNVQSKSEMVNKEIDIIL